MDIFPSYNSLDYQKDGIAGLQYKKGIKPCTSVKISTYMKKPLTKDLSEEVKALKKRTRAGFGGCQGGFCQPAVVMLLANHFNKDVTEVLYDKDESNICKYETKKEAR